MFAREPFDPKFPKDDFISSLSEVNEENIQ